MFSCFLQLQIGVPSEVLFGSGCDSWRRL